VRRTSGLLFSRGREEQILEIEAEICRARYGVHLCAIRDEGQYEGERPKTTSHAHA
jgi:hypothetical protein